MGGGEKGGRWEEDRGRSRGEGEVEREREKRGGEKLHATQSASKPKELC